MSTAHSQKRDLAIGRHAVMAEAFELLAAHLGPFIDERMAGYYVDEASWIEAAADRLGRPTEHGATDPLFLLLVLRRFWGPVFADFYGQDLRQIIGQLIDTRNKWAHFSFPDDPAALQRSVLAIERLLAPVEPDVAGRLRQLRSKVDRPGGRTTAAPVQQVAGQLDPVAMIDPADGPASDQSDSGSGEGEPAAKGVGQPGDPSVMAAEGRTGTPIDDPISDPIGDEAKAQLDELLTQLSETESVFRDLQHRYGDLLEELNNTRQVTATKQVRLSAMEQRLVEMEDHSTAVLEDLMEERITRHHIEWLIVGLLATLLLFMLLAST